MMVLVSAALVLLATVLALPVLVVFVQVLAATLRRGSDSNAHPSANGLRPRVAVLIPAHNESSGIESTLRALLPQLGAQDRAVVVADNCNDDTAAVARLAGAEVIERADATRRGKGYALDFGIRHLAADAPDIVIMVDADCEVAASAIERLSLACARSGRPVQALYLMHTPAGSGLRSRLAEFAWIVKNHVRPLGSLRLGVGCQLMGTGMAFPWPMIRDAELASGHIVEDMKLGVDLAVSGSAPLFCPDALVSSSFPSDAGALVAQRTRWEHGHLGMIRSSALPLLAAGVRRGQASLFALGLDLGVPPLAWLVLTLLSAVILAGIFAAVGGSALALMVAAGALAVLFVSVVLAWAGFARNVVSFSELLGAPWYALRKIPIYLNVLRKRQVEWVRTKRDGGGAD